MAKRDEYPVNKSMAARLQAAAEGLAASRGMLTLLQEWQERLNLPDEFRTQIAGTLALARRGSAALSGDDAAG